MTGIVQRDASLPWPSLRWNILTKPSGFAILPAVKDLKNPAWIKLKGTLFLAAGVASSLLLFLEHPTWRVAVLLIISIWCCCRFYYFAFYVIEHYVDPGYRFSGLGSFAKYLLRKRR